MITLKNKRASIVGLADGRKLKPTEAVELSEAEYAALHAIEAFRKFVKAGYIEVRTVREEVEPELPEPTKDAIDKLSTSDAKLLIASTDDEDMLMDWHSRDRRKSIKKLIEKRIAELQPSVEDE